MKVNILRYYIIIAPVKSFDLSKQRTSKMTTNKTELKHCFTGFQDRYRKKSPSSSCENLKHILKINQQFTLPLHVPLPLVHSDA